MKKTSKRLTALLALTALITLLLPLPAAAAQTDTQLQWLVNIDHPIGRDYVPSDLVYVSGSSQRMRAEAAAAFERMQAAAYAEGAGWLVPSSGYRSYATQSSLFYGRLASAQASGLSYDDAWASVALFTAVPGTSEHQTGLAMDITQNTGLDDSFADTPGGRWLRDNSWRFGFILRYTEAKLAYTKIGDEPWHYRYVGVPHAQIAYQNGWCWEEYISCLQKNGSLRLETGDGMAWDVRRVSSAGAAWPDTVMRSADNAGGYIVTTYHAADPLAKTAGHWSQTYFDELLGGRALPYPGTVDPDAPITRAGFAALFALLPMDASGEAVHFADVPADAWYAESAEKLARAGAMRGSGGLFRPDAQLTREEAATAAANLIGDNSLAYLTYSDLGSISGWAFQGVQKLTLHGVMSGWDNRFSPKSALRWGEAAALLCRLRAFLEAPEVTHET